MCFTIQGRIEINLKNKIHVLCSLTEKKNNLIMVVLQKLWQSFQIKHVVIVRRYESHKCQIECEEV